MRYRYWLMTVLEKESKLAKIILTQSLLVKRSSVS